MMCLPDARTSAVPETDHTELRARTGLLVIDEDPITGALLSHGLPPYGFTVWIATHGSAALDLYRRHRSEIDLVLLDGGLLEYDGLDTLAALRRLDPKLRCCFSCEFLDHHDAEQLFAQGAVGILTKPFRLDGLATALQLLNAHSEA